LVSSSDEGSRGPDALELGHRQPRRTLGTAVFGGMATATFLAVFIVAALYAGIQPLAERRARPQGAPAAV